MHKNKFLIYEILNIWLSDFACSGTQVEMIFEKIKKLEIYVVTNVLLPGILPGIISSFCQMANQTKFKKGNSKFHRIGSFFKMTRNKNAFFVAIVASVANCKSGLNHPFLMMLHFWPSKTEIVLAYDDHGALQGFQVFLIACWKFQS